MAQAAATVSSVSAFSAERVLGANDRVNVALVGCGGRGRLVARLMREALNVDFIAVCDVFDPSAASARQWAGPTAQSFRDFRRVLEMKEVDAVVVATPDHWHAIPTVLACQAGKDVFVEKPLGLTIREGRAMLEAARRYNRIVQAGLQHRSAPHYKEVEDIIQSGQIGEVHFVHVCNYSTVYTAAGGPPPNSDPPEGLDWDMYLGPAPQVPFNNLRFRTYRRFYDYSGGFITDFGAHRLDSVHQVMHDDRPLSAMGVGGLHGPKSIIDTPNVHHVTYEYKDWVLSYEGIQLNGFGAGPRLPGGRVPYNASGPHDRPHGEAFYGTKGTIFSDRVGYEIFPAARGGGEPRSVAGRDCTDLHTRNFIDCVRSRQRPVADVEIGHKSTIVAHLGNISFKVGGRKIRWDPDKEQVVDDPQASALLERKARKPWDLI
jgi:predicted dehydrogenase